MTEECTVTFELELTSMSGVPVTPTAEERVEIREKITQQIQTIAVGIRPLGRGRGYEAIGTTKSIHVDVADHADEPRDWLASAREEWGQQFGGGMIPFDDAYHKALAAGATIAEAQYAGGTALLDAYTEHLRRLLHD